MKMVGRQIFRAHSTRRQHRARFYTSGGGGGGTGTGAIIVTGHPTHIPDAQIRITMVVTGYIIGVRLVYNLCDGLLVQRQHNNRHWKRHVRRRSVGYTVKLQIPRGIHVGREHVGFHAARTVRRNFAQLRIGAARCNKIKHNLRTHRIAGFCKGGGVHSNIRRKIRKRFIGALIILRVRPGFFSQLNRH